MYSEEMHRLQIGSALPLLTLCIRLIAFDTLSLYSLYVYLPLKI